MNELKKAARALLKEKVLLVAIIGFIVISFASPVFFKSENLANLSVQVAVFGTVALGMTFCIIGGEFDLSVGSMLSLSGVLTVFFAPKTGIAAAIVLALVICTLLGVLNGFLVAKAKITAFIVTFGSMITVKGIALTVADGKPIVSENQAFNDFGSAMVGPFPASFVIFIGLLFACFFILRYTRFGRNIYAIGGNGEVAKATGINVAFYKGSIFALTALFAASMGVILAARLNSGSPIQGDDMTLTVIASVVIGGTSLSGGKGSILRTLLGVFVMMLLINAFDLLGVQPYIQKVIKGVIIIAVVAADSYNKKKIAV